MKAQPGEYKTRAFELRNLVFYFLLAYGLTWISAILIYLFDMKIPTRILDPLWLFVLFIGLPGAFGPTVAAFVMTAVSEGKAGVKSLWGRLWNRNLTFKWLLVTLFANEVLRLAGSVTARVVDGQAYPILSLPDPLWSFMVPFTYSFVISGLGEEFGWRGYVLPRFQARWNALTSSLILSALWTAWHIPFFFLPDQNLYQRNFLRWLPWIMLSSVIITWIFNNSKGSVLAAALFHATANYSIVVLPTKASVWYLYGYMMLAVLLIVIFFGAKNLVRQKAGLGTAPQNVDLEKEIAG